MLFYYFQIILQYTLSHHWKCLKICSGTACNGKVLSVVMILEVPVAQSGVDLNLLGSLPVGGKTKFLQICPLFHSELRTARPPPSLGKIIFPLLYARYSLTNLPEVMTGVKKKPGGGEAKGKDEYIFKKSQEVAFLRCVTVKDCKVWRTLLPSYICEERTVFSTLT